MNFNIFFLLITIICQAQSNDILGVWLEEKKESKIEVYKKDNSFFGKIIWLKKPLDEDGNIKLDKKNPNNSLRENPINGLVIMKDLKYKKKGEWSDGEIYDARSGKTYSLEVYMKNVNKLDLRGYLGFTLFGKTTTWTRVKN
tara:strand:+ start:6832 stop:7257 length:426 start_codon:yes stop_codon:yes gene_type:complete